MLYNNDALYPTYYGKQYGYDRRLEGARTASLLSVKNQGGVIMTEGTIFFVGDLITWTDDLEWRSHFAIRDDIQRYGEGPFRVAEVKKISATTCAYCHHELDENHFMYHDIGIMFEADGRMSSTAAYPAMSQQELTGHSQVLIIEKDGQKIMGIPGTGPMHWSGVWFKKVSQ